MLLVKESSAATLLNDNINWQTIKQAKKSNSGLIEKLSSAAPA